MSTKGAADARLARPSAVMVLRPSIVYGPGDHSMSVFLSLAALPVTPVPGDGQYRASAACTWRTWCGRWYGRWSGMTWWGLMVEVGGAEPVTFRALLDTLAQWSAGRRVRGSCPCRGR